MLFVAQRVVSPVTGQHGVNAYRYVHAETGRRTNPEDYFELPCTLVSQSVPVPGGGNPVRSFLDIAAPNDVTADEMARSVQYFADLAAPPPDRVHFYGEACAFRFAVEGSLLPVWRSEFLDLVRNLTTLP